MGPEKRREANRKVYERHRQNPAWVEGRKAIMADYRARKPEKYREYRANYRARLVKATPAWASKAKIAAIYELAEQQAKLSQEITNVDHIVPLNSPLVCGLHTEDNLTIVIGQYNNRKNNRTWPNMP